MVVYLDRAQGDRRVIDLDELRDAWGSTVITKAIEALSKEIDAIWVHIRALEAGLSEYEARRLRERVVELNGKTRAERRHED